MFFTQEDFLKIERWLNNRSVKDTAFEITKSLKKNDTIPVVQDYTNKRITSYDFALLLEMMVGNYINVSTVYGKYCIRLKEAIELVPPEGRRTGFVITFLNEEKKWVIYQFNSSDVNNWSDVDYWVNTYDNISKFKGFFTSEEALLEKVRYPSVGDYAYVGETQETAVLYVCEEDEVWRCTNTPAQEFVNLFEGVHSRDFSELDYNIDEQYCDRAEKDSLGRVIHFTYVTKDGITNFVWEKILKALSEVDLPEGIIKLEHLSDSLKDYIGSGGAITNMPDEEDLTTINQVLKFKDKEYAPTAFSGLGRKYLRKNMVDGVNVLEQYMIDEPNTIYIIQYDFCLNDTTITIPENCELRFDGGTINGGTLALDYTKVTGVNMKKEMGINLKFEGYFREGQSFYNNLSEKVEYFDGVFWVDALGTYIDLNKE